MKAEPELTRCLRRRIRQATNWDGPTLSNQYAKKYTKSLHHCRRLGVICYLHCVQNSCMASMQVSLRTSKRIRGAKLCSRTFPCDAMSSLHIVRTFATYGVRTLSVRTWRMSVHVVLNHGRGVDSLGADANRKINGHVSAWIAVCLIHYI